MLLNKQKDQVKQSVINSDNSSQAIAYERTFYALGTKNSIKILEIKNEQALDQAVQRVLEIDQKMSAYNEDSDISKIRKNAGKGYVTVDKDTYTLIKKSVQYSKDFNGAFDITIRPLIELWGINKKGDYIPSTSEIKKVLPLVDYKDISFRNLSKSIALKKENQAIDLGGIAKGYAADEVCRILKENGVNSAIINLGGNIITLGKKIDGTPFRIGIQNPMSRTGDIIGTLNVTDKTIVTSGSNERFFIKDGVRYHHLLNPRTGMPARSGLLSVTVICNKSIEADALSTAIFIQGMERGRKLLKDKKAEAIFIHEDLSALVTEGLKDNFQLRM
ncbi:FAD:protein FMN transferase [Anaeromicropila herbilytica]|uniref:FAD:protein FMN transferase n=1 Tax=Anaeromicropila herbilytica TaxID=2785025 RepID=A0A7R7EJH1_9FIRM|nr:FAD:protein FMN transferase [Anaeromicropila herbilytica]BCN29910.1 FAD:protein FMN transferase [Anaeromicropila herbilytica]